MTVTLNFSSDGKRVDILCSGRLTGGDLDAVNRELYSGEHKGDLRLQLLDLSAVEELDVTSEETKALARQDVSASATSPGMAIVIIADEDLAFGLSRMWEAFTATGDLRTAVVRTRREAERWIRDNVTLPEAASEQALFSTSGG